MIMTCTYNGFIYIWHIIDQQKDWWAVWDKYFTWCGWTCCPRLQIVVSVAGGLEMTVVKVEFLPTTWLGGVSLLGMGGIGRDDNNDDNNNRFGLIGCRVGALEWMGMWVEVDKASDWLVVGEACVMTIGTMAGVDGPCWVRHGDPIDIDGGFGTVAEERATLCDVVDLAGMLSTKSMTCVPDGTVDLAFAFFCLWLLLILLLSLLLQRFEGLAPRTTEKERRKKKKAPHTGEWWHMSEPSRFPCIMTPVGVLDNSEPFNFPLFPVSITIAKFGKVGL